MRFGVEKVNVVHQADGPDQVEVQFIDHEGTRSRLVFSGRVRSTMDVALNVAVMRVEVHSISDNRTPQKPSNEILL